MRRDFAAFRVFRGLLRKLYSQADSQGRDSRTQKTCAEPPQKRAMFHVSERVFHGNKRQSGGANSPSIGGRTAGEVTRGRALRKGVLLPWKRERRHLVV
jgi:hypothetical protein